MSRRPARRQRNTHSFWFPILVAIGVSLGGWSFLGCTPQRPAVAVATQTPGATATPLPPTHTPTIPPTATVVPTPTSSPPPLPTATAQPQVLTHITIVHSNDTWGYTLPCG